MWGPQLQKLATIIIDGAKKYPESAEKYINDAIDSVAYEVSVVENIPLPEDEVEEKTMDIAEVEAQVMSRKAYMKKWRGLTDDDVEEELQQMALERQILEDAAFGAADSEEEPYPGEKDNVEVVLGESERV